MILATIGFYLLLIVLWATVILWLTAIFWTERESRELRPLSGKNLRQLSKEPRISILLPARNEEQRVLADCVLSLLAQNYQNFEIIALNDRSTDGTSEILHILARENIKLQVIEGAELPADWLGKPFALQQAFQKASGEWILSTDADIIFAPDAIRTALALAEENNLDALCLIPFDVCGSAWEKIFLPTFSWFRMLKMPPSLVNNPSRPESMGVGNFFLIRRAALEKINGFDFVKTSIAEDLLLAQTLKKNGWRFQLGYAPNLLQTRMYSGLMEIWEGFTKNFFAASDFSLAGTIFGAGSILLFGVVPIVLLLFFLAIWLTTGDISLLALLIPAILIYICQTIVFAIFNRAFGQSLRYAFLTPFGLAMFGTILIGSAIKVLTGRGVVWKGRNIYQRQMGDKQCEQILESK